MLVPRPVRATPRRQEHRIFGAVFRLVHVRPLARRAFRTETGRSREPGGRFQRVDHAEGGSFQEPATVQRPWVVIRLGCHGVKSYPVSYLILESARRQGRNIRVNSGSDDNGPAPDGNTESADFALTLKILS